MFVLKIIDLQIIKKYVIIKIPEGYDNYNIKPTKIYLGSLKSGMCRMLNSIKNPDYWMVTYHLSHRRGFYLY